ncbi:MAG TPA: hypothetical protein DCX17_03230 [Firmicutes bacterium]|nr:hypothetical protein [Bacillota bacterium]
MLISIIIVTVLVALFITGYVLNKKTPIPAGCENLTTDCASCGITSCSLHKPTSDKVEVI